MEQLCLTQIASRKAKKVVVQEDSAAEKMKRMIHDPNRWSPAVQGEDSSMWSHFRRKSKLYHVPRVTDRFMRDSSLMDKMYQEGAAVHSFHLDSVRASSTGGLRDIMRAADIDDPGVWGGKMKRRFIPQDKEAFGWSNAMKGAKAMGGAAVLSRSTLERLSAHPG